MWNKLYLVILSIGVLAMLCLTYLSYSWLQSVTKPADVVANYTFYNTLYWNVLGISSLLLLIVANVILWINRKSWALWLSLLYFAVFVILQTFWLGETYSAFQTQNNLPAVQSSFGGMVLGVLLCVIAAVAVFFDQFLVTKMRDRVHGETPQIVNADSTIEEQ